ncbi:uncharacterized protein At4g06744-like isoform X1 [Prosopis cineraria]|uniref:uncharacterized protein At4g06744-like isoform X1 n=1 Tax=Prosopis cineraria TaxID=364024 RepID=UPI00240EEFA9|nr:uncharacterized protein At4g06744-like isoform X1 [Prosopis cineraria]
MGTDIQFPYYTMSIFFTTVLLCFLTVNPEIILESPSTSPPSSSLSPFVPEIFNFIDQRIALVFPIIQTFKNTITSDPLGVTKTWVGPNICNYTGFYCDNPPDNLTAITVASIDFNEFRLVAPSLEGFIDKLPDLALFHANSNNFSGTIPPTISELRFLYELDVSNNLLSGTFPVAVLGLPNLSFLDIRFNFFSGNVPPEIFMQSLDVVFLNDNNFMQRLPVDLGDTTVLYLTLANNKFTGPIPRSIGRASETLLEILFLNNQLTGCLPYEIGFLTKLRLLDAGNNHLTGPLPCSLGCLEAVEQLNLAGNLLYGQIPEVVCALGNLVNLSLSDNYFARVGPLCRKLIKRGVLDVRKNCIFGYGVSDQRPTEECFRFYMHPRSCFNPASFKFIPCKVSPWGHLPRVGRTPNRHLLSYSALSRARIV